MNVLRKYVRALLTEITQLPPDFFTVVDDAIMSSQFWTMPNDDEDISSTGKTPAANVLEKAIQQAMQDVDLDMDVIVDSYFTDDPDMMLHPEHPAYPNKWLIDARWYISKRNPGRSTIDLMLMMGDEDEGFDASDVNPKALTQHIASTIRHELVHYTQMKKQSLNKGIYDDTKAFEEMLQDPSQIANEDDPKYWEIYEPTGEIDQETKKEIINKEGFKSKLWQTDYLQSHIEIDAHAHDAAEDLLAIYGEDKAMDQLRYGFDLSDPDLPNGISHYYKILPKGDPTIKKLRKKVYSYMKHFAKRDKGSKK
jgi:hypothetical protein